MYPCSEYRRRHRSISESAQPQNSKDTEKPTLIVRGIYLDFHIFSARVPSIDQSNLLSEDEACTVDDDYVDKGSMFEP